MRKMKHLRNTLAPVALLALAACGGGGSSGSPPDVAPSISNLRYTPTSALQSPGGVATLSGTIDFSDSGANVSSLHLSTSAGATLTVAVPLPGVTQAG